MKDTRGLAIRMAEETDLPFVYSTWLRNYRFSSTGFTQSIDKETYYAYHGALIGALLNRGCRLLVCVDRQDPKVIYGYLVSEMSKSGKQIFHYGYVKKAFRMLGIFWYLLESAGFDVVNSTYTHQTKDFKQMVEKYKWTCTYNPYLVAGV